MTVTEPRLGEGAYTFREAASILRGITRPVTTRQLRYWMDSGLSPASHRVEGEPVLSFDDLISLEVVRRLRDGGASLQSIRAVEQTLREEYPDLDRPFAFEVFFTDGANVWVSVAGDTHLVKELHHRKNQFAWRDAIATFATDIKFEGPRGHATRWQLSPWIEINPAIQHGSPVVTGSRVTIKTIAANLEAGTPEQVSEWYGLRVEQVEGVRDYLAIH